MRKLLFLVLLFAVSLAKAQAPQKLNAAEIYQSIKKLNFLGSVLYVAAHPDDENTRLISYFANEVHARTGYLSLTRGDGGQNLIGPELKEVLGVIRTHELLAAREIDGGEQLFTRAVDFGYTKTPEEALEFWNQDEILSDVVWAIRKFKPDVIINRFDHRTAGETHGQHTASAILTVEAFDLANDPAVFPDQLEYTQAFQPKRLFFNTSPWFFESEEAFEKATASGFIQFETGVYFPLLGLSNPEIASLSRSQHQSQGFGSTGSRGSQTEYLEILKGNLPKVASSPFEGINTSWNRVKGGKAIGKILYDVEQNFNFLDPSRSIPQLVEAYKLIRQLDDEHWREIKTREIKEIIAASAGLYLEAVAQVPNATWDQEIKINLEAINRSTGAITLKNIKLIPTGTSLQPNLKLENNVDWREAISFTVPGDMDFTSPYWLREEGSIGKYKVNDRNLIGLPKNPPAIEVEFALDINNTSIPFRREVVYKYNDAVEGEVYQPFEIIPQVAAKIQDRVLIFRDELEKNIPVTLLAGKDNIAGELTLQAGPGWKVSPPSIPFSIKEKGSTVTVNFQLSPPKEQSEANLEAVATINGIPFKKEVFTLNYKHIPSQILVLPSISKLVKLDIKTKGENIGFIEGAGDVIPESMEQIGYKVTSLNPQYISAASLANFDAVILGIRAYNTVEELKYRQEALLKYVENGGTLIVQYNTNRGLIVNPFAPYKLQLSRIRVTEEDAEVRFVSPEHPVLNTPNKITEKDFENWVQERGLYFANEWGEEFTPVLSMNDTNEAPALGSLLIAKYGKGHFIYTGLSFFRQFPEGVAGAYRLFANLTSLGKE